MQTSFTEPPNSKDWLLDRSKWTQRYYPWVLKIFEFESSLSLSLSLSFSPSLALVKVKFHYEYKVATSAYCYFDDAFQFVSTHNKQEAFENS